MVGVEEVLFTYGGEEFKVIDVGGQRSERRKWISNFDSVTSVIFCASLNGYDQVLREDHTQLRMKEALMLFDEVANSHWFYDAPMILFLNKLDLFQDKIRKVNLNVCFDQYQGELGDEESAKTFIKQRFLEKTNQQVYTHFTTAINTENIKFVIDSVRAIALQVLFRTTTPM